MFFWRCLQAVIVGLVVASNIRWAWTPNPTLAGALGVITAIGVTWCITRALDLLHALRHGRLRADHRQPPEIPDWVGPDGRLRRIPRQR